MIPSSAILQILGTKVVSLIIPYVHIVLRYMGLSVVTKDIFPKNSRKSLNRTSVYANKKG